MNQKFTPKLAIVIGIIAFSIGSSVITFTLISSIFNGELLRYRVMGIILFLVLLLFLVSIFVLIAIWRKGKLTNR